MASVVKITPAMLPELCQGLLSRLDPQIEPQVWHDVFCPPWHPSDATCGFALAEGGRLVGVLGTIHSARRISGGVERFCNLHSWYVEPSHRAKSLLLLRPVLELKDHTLTDFSATSRVSAISKRLGFESLERTAVVMPVLPAVRRAVDADVRVLHGPSSGLPAALGDAQRQIYADHRHTACGHALVESDGGSCYLVYSSVAQRFLSHCYLHHVSRPDLLARYHRAIRARLAAATGRRMLAVDARLVSQVRVPHSFRVRAVEKLYRPHRAERCEIDTLYSELVYFRIPSLLSIRRQFWPSAQ